jgi:hypothetical protein
MGLIQFTAEVIDGRLLELPAEADELQLKPGDKVQVRLGLKPPWKPKARCKPAEKQRVLTGLGAFKGMIGGTEAVLREKQSEIELEERRF